MIRTPAAAREALSAGKRRATEMPNRRRIRLIEPDEAAVPKNINTIADYEEFRKVRDDTV